MNWYSINNSINNALSIAIDEEIGSFGIDAKGFIDEVKDSGASEIELTINSGGGSVFDALAIYDFLKNSSLKVSVKIEGLAASAATIIALAGDKKPVMTENSFFMIHNAWMPVVSMSGMNSDEIREYTEELEKQAQLMDKINLRLAKIYSNATGVELSEIQSMMAEETWLTAEEAETYGFISEVEGAMAIAAYVSPKELAKKGYKNTPKNYVNQLNNVDMSENKEKSFLKHLMAFFKEEVKAEAEEVEETPEVEAEAEIKEEVVAEEVAEEVVEETTEEAKEEVSEEVTEEPKAELDVEAIVASAVAKVSASMKEEFEAEKAELKKELDKAKASRKPIEAKEDVANPEKKEEVKDELGAAILNVLKASLK
jgi:ATP-dependent protease ClpP protease subunit